MGGSGGEGWDRAVTKTDTEPRGEGGGCGETICGCAVKRVKCEAGMRVSEADRCEARRSYAGAVVRAAYLAVGCAKGAEATQSCGEVRYGTAVVYFT